MSYSREFNDVKIEAGGPVLVLGTSVDDVTGLKSADTAVLISVAIVKHGSGAVVTDTHPPYLSGWEARFLDGVSFPQPDGSRIPLARYDEVLVVGVAHEEDGTVDVWSDTLTVDELVVEQ